MTNRVIGRGAHLLVQIRVAVLDGRLEHVFQRWYPRFRPLVPPAAPAP
jgi:hypothetical protein